MYKVVNKSNRILYVEGNVLAPMESCQLDIDLPNANLLRMKHNKVIDLIRVKEQFIDRSQINSNDSVKSPELLEDEESNNGENPSSKKSRKSRRQKSPEVIAEESKAVAEENKDESAIEETTVDEVSTNESSEVETVTEEQSSVEEAEDTTSE